ncbi:MAG: hypothetical protein CMN30_31080 [Sandaracinus sp.]|nr:hypothetical protein [Sandaracinus sp.]|tara:strand:- start:956 stop:1732 length:777 start_codon:yes stop_codon:yes gene_type:complete
MTPRLALPLLLGLASACASTPDPEPVEPVASTGGETETAVTEPVHPLRTTIPVPVPQPAVAREDLSEPLQETWTGIEEVVALRPPDGPVEPTGEAIRAWAEGPFMDWVTARRTATLEVGQVARGIPEEPVYERALGAALFGYALEDFAADIRSSPVPDSITSDPELLQIYVAALTEMLRPFALEAASNYAHCQQRLVTLGDESEWVPWRAYCVDRGREVIEVYQLQPATPPAGEGTADPTDAAPGEPTDAASAAPGEV